MANLQRTTATWEIVCFQLYTREEKRALLGYPPLTQRSLDEIFLCRAILGLLCVTDDDYMNLRKRLRSQGFSDNLIALSTLRAPRKQNFAKAYQRAKTASQTYGNYDDEDQDNNNWSKDYQQKIHMGFADLFRFTVQRRRAHQNPTSCPVNPPDAANIIYYSTGLLPHDLTPYRRDYVVTGISYITDMTPTSDQESKNDRPLEPCQEDIHRAFPAAPLTSPDHPAMPCGGILPLPADDAVLPHTNQWAPTTKKLLGAPSWELICLVLYDGYKKRELLGFPPKLTGREIDQIFLYRACTATLFMMGEDWMDLQQRLRSAGYYCEDLTSINSLSSDRKQPKNFGENRNNLHHSRFNHDEYACCSSKLFWLTQASIEARLKRKCASAVAQWAIQENYMYYGTSHDHPTVLHGPKGKDASWGPIARQRIVPESSTTFSIDQKLLPTMENTHCKEEKLATDAITVANNKVPSWQYPSKRNFRLVVIIAALLGALCLHVLHWNLLGTDHGLRGEPSKPQLRGSSFRKNVQAIWSSKKPFVW